MCRDDQTTFSSPSDEEAILLPDTFSFPAEVSGPAPEPEPPEVTASFQVEEELPPSSARDRAKILEELKDVLPILGEAQPAAEEEASAAPQVSPGEALQQMRDKRRRRDRSVLQDVYLNTISSVLRARNCRFSQGSYQSKDFFDISGLGEQHHPFTLTIELSPWIGVIHLTITLPFFCNAEMVPAAAYYLLLPPGRTSYNWQYDQSKQRFLACQTIPYWDPAYGEETVEHLLDDTIQQVELSFDVLQWLCTGFFSKPPEELTRKICLQVLKELEAADEDARQRMLTRLRLSLEPFP